MNINEEMKLHKWAQDLAEQQSSGLSQCPVVQDERHLNIPGTFEPPVRMNTVAEKKKQNKK